MQGVFLFMQSITATILVVAIVVQTKGKGFARTSGPSFTRRGLEKLVFKATFVVAAAFIAVSILQLTL